MYVARIPNRNSRPTYLIRHGRREGKKIIKTTILNITALPDHIIAGIRILLRGGTAVDDPITFLKTAFEFGNSTPPPTDTSPPYWAPCAPWDCPAL